MDGNRQISLILILCFSIFLGHNLIPHHHDGGFANIAMTGECSFDHVDHDPPNHCHAFNNIDFVHYSYTKIQPPVGVKLFGMVPVSKVKLEQPDSFVFKLYTTLKLPDKTPRYLGAISMRAPPISA